MSKAITLMHPITIDGRPVEQIQLRRATVGDIEIMDREETNMGKSIRLLSLLADDLTTDDIRRLDAEDFTALSEEIAGFLG